MGLGDLFRTTNKGILPMAELQQNTSLSRSLFGMSLGLQIVFMLFFVGIFGLAVFRSIKKIKNPKFKNDKDDDQSEDEENFQDETNAKETNDNLIYRFDEEDHQKEKKMEGEEEEDQKNSVDEESDDEYDREHDQHEERYLEMDHKLLFLQPFLICHVIANCIFAVDILSIGMSVATIVIFFIFNVKNACTTQKWTTILFFAPALAGFLPIFYSKHSMSP